MVASHANGWYGSVRTGTPLGVQPLIYPAPKGAVYMCISLIPAIGMAGYHILSPKGQVRRRTYNLVSVSFPPLWGLLSPDKRGRSEAMRSGGGVKTIEVRWGAWGAWEVRRGALISYTSVVAAATT